ncbi:MAG: hypothetical protein UR66_C0002G0127 [Candidatus Moranbacteria bacterium GW2011_GWE1_35_17]|nr:MAG: hypothetical protein UR65_C0070G0001 [Candidatus Moranbacteria bacterium GW2011_GWE2_35_164]KKP69070.1 MAG: hypothetical protein UR66_C0002G0127 [Candidatus Moranbacteria bacterium GW2011_GWE1_35_17]KKP81637.1 MAG: hypothetical protein UR83_C0070G0003 [Candidatus Moranbacteria bacterium GW2011_GWF2_35_54]KKP84494.1 MAG: hypothetical protein UR82_C0004G0010 [Candidatus Moranbacteria bacterium GW2011_GWF1_35_5]
MKNNTNTVTDTAPYDSIKVLKEIATFSVSFGLSATILFAALTQEILPMPFFIKLAVVFTCTIMMTLCLAGIRVTLDRLNREHLVEDTRQLLEKKMASNPQTPTNQKES